MMDAMLTLTCKGDFLNELMQAQFKLLQSLKRISNSVEGGHLFKIGM